MRDPGAEYVDWLGRNHMLDLEQGQPPGPEQDRPDGSEWEWWKVDWGGFLKGGEDEEFEPWLDPDAVGRILDEPLPDGWESQSSGGFDICAWYSQMHFYGSGWGITILNDCVIRIAQEIRHFLAYPSTFPWLLAHQLSQAAFDLLFQHELFHHKCESLALRLEITTQQSAYIPYTLQVYRPSFGTNGCLEEAVANAFSFRWMKSSETARRALGRDVRDAAISRQLVRLPHDPPGYNQALSYVDDLNFRAAESLLSTQVHERSSTPAQSADEFALATHLTRPLYTKQSDIWVLVQQGTRPTLPTGTFPLTTCSTSDMEKILEQHGYTKTKGGKGSHVKLAKPGSRPVTLPGNRKNLSPGVTKEALAAINMRLADLRDLLNS